MATSDAHIMIQVLEAMTPEEKKTLLDSAS
jgi:hypothetical protein